MEEQILEARLGDVDILNRDAGVRRGGDDGWNQRAAPVCVQIDLAVGLCRASLGDARQRAERVDERRGRGVEMQSNEEPARKPDAIDLRTIEEIHV